MDTFPIAGRLLRLLNPELAHAITVRSLALGLGGIDKTPDDPLLHVQFCGLDLPNPLGLAAGFDKDATVVDALLGLGFGFVEAGTVTPRPQSGNPKPRLFRLPAQEAVINRMGFNSRGLGPFVHALKARRDAGRRGIVGANLGKNRDSLDAARDYVAGIYAAAPYADYIVINISSPNTPGLRDLQGRAPLETLLKQVMEARAALDLTRPPPLLVKVAPDLEPAECAEIADVCLAAGIDGLVVGNTTVSRPNGLPSVVAAQQGGLSGRPLFALSTATLACFYRETHGRLPLMGVGGITSGADAYAKIGAGASMVQLYTALIYHGPAMINRIKRDLADLLRRDGFMGIAEAVGHDIKV